MPSVPGGVRGAVITGWGTALPDEVVTNEDLAGRMDTSHEWIVERTGIHQRHIGGTTAELAAQAGERALEMAGVDRSEIDVLVLATTTPDRMVPATSAVVQDRLGLRCGAMDINAACSGFVYSLVVAHGMIAAGARKALVIGAETLSRLVDWEDRSTAILFGDGAGAVVLEAEEGPGQLLGWDIDADGSLEHLLFADLGAFIRMDGKEVFRRAVRIMVDSATKSLAAAGVGVEDLAVVVPHQANIRIIESAMSKLGVPVEKGAIVLHRTGNTSSASIPLALAEALDDGRIKNGDLVLLVGFGAGMTAASAVLRWGGSA